MSTTGIVVLIVIIALALIVLGLVMASVRKRRSGQLRERFGPEYDRTVDEEGGRRAAESRLAGSAKAHDKVEIRDLDASERERYTRDWSAVQAAFVDHPQRATKDADQLVGVVMRSRGYPVDDFNTKSDMIAIDHPQVAEHYRAAHDIGARSDQASTEELRQAFVHYRALFEQLLAGGDQDRSTQRVEDTQAADATRDGQGSPNGVDLTERDRTRQAPPTT